MIRPFDVIQAIRKRYTDMLSVLDERGRRLFVAAEARAYGLGGAYVVEQATGVARSTINRGIAELKANPPPRPRTTRPARPRSNGDNIQSAVSPDAALASREGDAQEKRLGRQDSNLRSVGHPRTKGDRILAEMREMDRFELRHMKGKEMEHRFKAVRSTCRHYRKQVLAENGDN